MSIGKPYKITASLIGEVLRIIGAVRRIATLLLMSLSGTWRHCFRFLPFPSEFFRPAGRESTTRRNLDTPDSFDHAFARGREGIARTGTYAVLLAALTAICLALPQVKESAAHASVGTTVAKDTGVITPSDFSTCTISAGEDPRGDRGMNERGHNAGANTVNAWIFEASCDGGTNTFEIRVHPDFTTQQAARTEAEKYGKAVGQLPKVLRSGFGAEAGIHILEIHKGTHQWHASLAFGEIRIYTEFGGHPDFRDLTLEEGLVHEAAHVSLDRNVGSDPKWLAAQKADGAFISRYAERHPDREDVAESFLAWFSVRFLPSRISEEWEEAILQTIPNRIAYFNALFSARDMKPFTAVSGQSIAALPLVSIAAKAVSVTEGGDAVFTIEASPAPMEDLTVTLTVSDDGTGDFLEQSDEGTNTTVIIPAGQTSATLTLATQDDSVDEPDGSVSATLAGGTGYAVAPPPEDAASVSVADDDDAPPATLPPVVQCASSLPANAVSVYEVEGWRDKRKRRGNKTLEDRWNRVLSALDPAVGTGAPMAAWEARKYAEDGGFTRWKRTAATLSAIERCLAVKLPPIVQCASYLPANAVSVYEVEGWRDKRKRRGNKTLEDRWNRVLSALDPAVGTGAPMAAREARKYAEDGGFTRWKRTAATLRAIERCLSLP